MGCQRVKVSATLAVMGAEWMTRASCRDYDPDLFFPEQGGNRQNQQAKRVCAKCPVWIECRTMAIQDEEPFGVWGGLSEKDRRKISRLSQRHACPECEQSFGTERKLSAHVGHHTREKREAG